MNSLTRWDPFREMVDLRREMDRLFDNAFYGGQPGWQQTTGWSLPLDVSENQDEYLVKASIPGINPDDLEITYNANTLTIRGEVQEDQELKESQVHMRERRFGSFARSISLPTPVSAEAIEANYEAGVLTLRLPKAEEAKPKRIAIQSGAGKVIEGQLSNGKKK